MNGEEELTLLVHKIKLKEEELTNLKNRLNYLILTELKLLKGKNEKKE